MGDMHKGEYEARMSAVYGSHQLAQQQALGLGSSGLLQGLGSGILAGQAIRGSRMDWPTFDKPKTYKDELQAETDEWLEDIK